MSDLNGQVPFGTPELKSGVFRTTIIFITIIITMFVVWNYPSLTVCSINSLHLTPIKRSLGSVLSAIHFQDRRLSYVVYSFDLCIKQRPYFTDDLTPPTTDFEAFYQLR